MAKDTSTSPKGPLSLPRSFMSGMTASKSSNKTSKSKPRNNRNSNAQSFRTANNKAFNVVSELENVTNFANNAYENNVPNVHVAIKNRRTAIANQLSNDWNNMWSTGVIGKGKGSDKHKPYPKVQIAKKEIEEPKPEIEDISTLRSDVKTIIGLSMDVLDFTCKVMYNISLSQLIYREAYHIIGKKTKDSIPSFKDILSKASESMRQSAVLISTAAGLGCTCLHLPAILCSGFQMAVKTAVTVMKGSKEPANAPTKSSSPATSMTLRTNRNKPSCGSMGNANVYKLVKEMQVSYVSKQFAFVMSTILLNKTSPQTTERILRVFEKLLQTRKEIMEIVMDIFWNKQADLKPLLGIIDALSDQDFMLLFDNMRTKLNEVMPSVSNRTKH